MSLEKNYLKSKPVCKVKFVLPKVRAEGVKQVHLVGTFNDWDVEAAQPLRKQKTGEYTTTLSFSVGEQHEFRYLIDGNQWENDEMADSYAPSHVSCEENSVVVI